MKKVNWNYVVIICLLGLFPFIGACSPESKTFYAPTKEKVEFTDSTTAHEYVIQDDKYPIFKTKKGRYYIWRMSKESGKLYKYYIPKEIQSQIEENEQLLNK